MPTKTELEAAYRATAYRIFLPGGAVDLRIDAPHPTFAAWLAEYAVTRWAILTAFNPGSDRRPAAENAERQATLEIDLLEKGYEPFAGENMADGEAWPPEESCFVPGLDLTAAKELAERFGQNAFLFGADDGIPHLIWLA